MSFLPGLLWIALQSSMAVSPSYPKCENPSADDGRPYTLCVAETDFEVADAWLNRQWRKSLIYVSRTRGLKAKKQLLLEQRRWLRDRDRECDAVAASSPVTQSGRNQMSCLAQKTEERTTELIRMVR